MYLINRFSIRKLKNQLIKKYRFYSKTKAFENRYKNIDDLLFNSSLGEEIIQRYKEKWEVFGVKVEVDTFLLCYNISGKIDYNIIPENIFAFIIEPSLNKYKNKELSFIAIKNFYEKWFNKTDVFPKSFFHKIDNVYYDNKLNIIEDIEIFLDSENFKYPMICKPSMGTAGGIGVKLIYNLNEIKQSLDAYDNLVYQEKVLQNKLIEQINPSMNTIRTCLYRTKSGDFEVINNSIRFGVDGSLDNLKNGGVACYIGEQGRLNEFAVKMYCDKHLVHPNSKVRFSSIVIPFYKELFEVTEAIANQIPLCNLVSLDMCLDVNNNWRCIEVNLNAQTIRFSQYAGVGFFGKYTDEVINRVLNTI